MNSPLSRMGGKKLLRKEILKRFPEELPEKYVEVFGGAGWVLFASDKHAPIEVFNDIDGNLINLFRCMKYHRGELQKEIRWMLNSREMFEDALEQLACRGFTDIQRAAQYYLLVKESYGSDVRTYGGKPFRVKRTSDYLVAVQQRLENVRLENKNDQALIRQFDSEKTLFYLDPPYLGAEYCYAHRFTLEDHLCLKDTLNGVCGRFILSYNDHPQIREWYQNFCIEEVSRNNNLTGRYADRRESIYKELIIRNY